mmetsp:Transcript_3107/g.2786  ORF Transcript_3107/g.2786 Transcript_3107/m.2786 type:complete len:98 (+) Transcript_3107:35-328(+)
MSSSSSSLGGVDWSGLLAWSTKYHDNTNTSTMQPMSDERREFLQKAIEETLGTQENPNDLMKESITKLNTIITSYLIKHASCTCVLLDNINASNSAA